MPMTLPPFKLERYFARYEFNVRYLLCASDCESLSVRELLDMEPGSAEGLQGLRLGYTESQGAPGLRREICGLYSGMRPEEVLVHSGAEEAIFLFMHAALAPGDHVVVHSPCYQSLREVARSIGCGVAAWTAREADGWALDPGELESRIRPNTRAIVINTPHNPTGYLMPRDIFLAVNALARERGITLFSDEVYRESEYDPTDLLPPACDVNDTAVSLGVLSKTYGLPGLRIGWIATHDARLCARMAALKDYTTICNSAPAELLAEVALRHRSEIARRNLGIISANLAVLDSFFRRRADRFSWVRPRAGSIAFPRLIGAEVAPFCHELVTKAGVLLLPGTLFDDEGNHFRIGFGRRNMPQAVERLEEYLGSQLTIPPASDLSSRK